jgi:hypothetical protein
MNRIALLARLSTPMLIALVLVSLVAVPVLAAPPVKGAIFTTDSACTVVNGNPYDFKEAVYLNGGPAKPGAAGLPDGYYYVRVTEPNGRLLGTSVGSGNDTPVHVTNGEFDECYNVYYMLVSASGGWAGFDDTSNGGGEYKVWVSNEPNFANNSTKTDNFKVVPGEIIGPQ